MRPYLYFSVLQRAASNNEQQHEEGSCAEGKKTGTLDEEEVENIILLFWTPNDS